MSPSSYRPPPTPRRSWIVRAVFAVLLAGLGVVLWNGWGHDAFVAWQQDAGPVPFFLAMAVLPLIGIPITPFFVIAGATFGTQVGLAGVLAALSVNLVASYWIARSGLRPWLERALARTRFSVPDFEERDGALRFAVLVKLAPGVPLFIKHYLLGLAGVPFWTYFLVSAGISGVYGASFVVLGESLLEQDIGTGIAALAVLAFVALAIFVWRRRHASGEAGERKDA